MATVSSPLYILLYRYNSTDQWQLVTDTVYSSLQAALTDLPLQSARLYGGDFLPIIDVRVCRSVMFPGEAVEEI